jgi:hypothetical protein
MGTLKVTLIGLLVALAMAGSVALVIRSLPDGEQLAPPMKEAARAPDPAPRAPAPAAPPPPPAKPEPAPTADQSRIPQAEDRIPQAEERIPQAAAQPEPQAEQPPAPTPAPFSTMQGRATELLAIPPAGVLGPPSAQPVQPTAPAAAVGPAAVGAGGRLAFSPAQEERMRYVLMSHNVMQTDAADFPLQLGNTVPENVRLLPLPIEVAGIVPNYRAYAYVISQNRIVIVTADDRTISSLISIEARG